MASICAGCQAELVFKRASPQSVYGTYTGCQCAIQPPAAPFLQDHAARLVAARAQGCHWLDIPAASITERSEANG